MTTPAGWYDDGSGRQRYWDGSQWTDQFAGEQAAPAPAAPQAQPAGMAPAYSVGQDVQPKKKSRLGLWIGLGIGGFVLLVGGAITAFVFLVVGVTQGPRDAFHELADAWRSGDCAAEYALLHPDYVEGATQDEWCEFSDNSWTEGWEYSIHGTFIENSTATVETTETYPGSDGPEEWVSTFERVDGEWLLVSSDMVE